MHFLNVLPLGVENQLKFQFHLPCATHVSIRSDKLKLIIRQSSNFHPLYYQLEYTPILNHIAKADKHSTPRVVLSLQHHTIICLDFARCKPL